MTEQVEAQAEAQSLDEAAVASIDLDQHGHAVAQLETEGHENPHNAGGEEAQK